MKELFDSINISVHHNKKESKLITPYGEIWMRSMDTPDRIVSYSVGYSIVDEVDVVHTNKQVPAMKRISSRNSFKKILPTKWTLCQHQRDLVICIISLSKKQTIIKYCFN